MARFTRDEIGLIMSALAYLVKIVIDILKKSPTEISK